MDPMAEVERLAQRLDRQIAVAASEIVRRRPDFEPEVKRLQSEVGWELLKWELHAGFVDIQRRSQLYFRWVAGLLTVRILLSILYPSAPW